MKVEFEIEEADAALLIETLEFAAARVSTEASLKAIQNLNNVFDPLSIMLYPIPAEHTKNGFTVGWNTQLSEQDKQLIAENYK
jgi:hypothetical protein